MPFRLPAPVLLLLLALVFATLVALGAWQVQRDHWKTELVATRNAQLASAPLAVEAARALSPADLEYRTVTLTGRWDAERTLILANRARYGVKGENVVQPFVLASGEAVLVDRGWYPFAERDAVLARLRDDTTGTTSGLARYVEGLSATQTAAGTWTGIAPESMAAGLPYRVLPWWVTEGTLLPDNAPIPTAYPAQGFSRYVSNVSHKEYAATWFGLALVLVVAAVLRLVVEPRRARARLEAAGSAAEAGTTPR